jgi:hypothetical protein
MVWLRTFDPAFFAADRRGSPITGSAANSAPLGAEQSAETVSAAQPANFELSTQSIDSE